MTPDYEAKLYEAALNACIIHDHEGEPTQDPWAHDRFLAGAAFAKAHHDEKVKVLVEALKRYAESNDLKGYLHPADLAREALAEYEKSCSP